MKDFHFCGTYFSYLSLHDLWIGAVTDVTQVKNLGLLSLKMSSLPWTDV